MLVNHNVREPAASRIGCRTSAAQAGDGVEAAQGDGTIGLVFWERTRARSCAHAAVTHSKKVIESVRISAPNLRESRLSS